jgi:hypothetical protein
MRLEVLTDAVEDLFLLTCVHLYSFQFSCVGKAVKISHLKIGSIKIMDGLSPPYPPCTVTIVLTRGRNFIFIKFLSSLFV